MKKKTKLIIVAVVVVIAVIAGSLGAYFGYFKPHKEAVEGKIDDVEIKLISADYLDFNPMKI